MVHCGLVGGQRVTDLVSVGVLASWLSRDAVDEAVVAAGRQVRRRGGSLPPHVTAYLVIAMALFPDSDYEDVAARLAGGLEGLGCWLPEWEPTSGGITRARRRLGPEPLEALFAQVAVPVAELDTPGAFLGPWRLMSIDGMEWDVPDTPANREAFGDARGAFPRARVVTVGECGSHAHVLAAIGGTAAGKGGGEQGLARRLYPRLEEGWLLLADRGFYCFADWCAAAGTGADLLWRVRENTRLPPLEPLPDGSYRSVLIDPRVVSGPRREGLIAAARAGQELDQGTARHVRVIEYDVRDREGSGQHERIVLATTITGWRDAPAPALAGAYHQRWEHEGGNGQLKTTLRGPGRILRSKSPDMARQEIWGYLLAHYGLCALACAAATAAGIDPDRVKYKRTLQMVRRAVGPAFPP
jgi:hypothetical protein